MRRLLLSAALFFVFSPVAANAEVVAICGKSVGYANAAISAPVLGSEETVATPLALWRDAEGFDLLLNWGEPDQHSLRADGAEIIGNELGSELIHLVVIRLGTQGLEHFLFSLEEDSPGELIWNAPASKGQDSNGVLSYQTTCFKSK